MGVRWQQRHRQLKQLFFCTREMPVCTLSGGGHLHRMQPFPLQIAISIDIIQRTEIRKSNCFTQTCKRQKYPVLCDLSWENTAPNRLYYSPKMLRDLDVCLTFTHRCLATGKEPELSTTNGPTSYGSAVDYTIMCVGL